MIELTRVYAEGMKGHVSYKIFTKPLLVDPAAITVISELETDSYKNKINGIGPFHVVTKLQVGDQTYHVLEAYKDVWDLVKSELAK